VDAIILVGGQGTRLRPLTTTRHKSLVPLLNRPAIEYLFEWLARSGIERAVLALGQANEDLAATYPAGLRGGLEIVPIIERERLESGGAIRNAARTTGIDGRFIVLNGDVYADFDLRAAIVAHESFGADLTLALCEVDDPSAFGIAVTDSEGLVTGFVEKPPRGEEPSRLVNAGVWIFEPGLVDEIPAGAVRVEETLFPSLVARRRRVLGYRFAGPWADLGTPQRYLEASRMLLGEGNAIAGDVHVGAGADIRGSAVGGGSVIGPEVRISDSILWEGVAVGERAQIERSILADGVVVGTGARLTGVVAGQGAYIASGTQVPAGTSIEARGRYDGPHG